MTDKLSFKAADIMIGELEAHASIDRAEAAVFRDIIERALKAESALAEAEGREVVKHKALADLIDDLKERAEWDLDGAPKVVCCGNGVFIRAEAALTTPSPSRVADLVKAARGVHRRNILLGTLPFELADNLAKALAAFGGCDE